MMLDSTTIARGDAGCGAATDKAWEERLQEGQARAQAPPPPPFLY